MEKAIVTVSDATFHQKIINKYSKGKRNIFSFPLMIFRKSSEDFQSQHINMDILIQLHIHNQNMVPSLIVKNVKSTKKLLLWIEKLIPHFILKPALLRSKQDTSKTVHIFHGAISGSLPPKCAPANRVSIVSFTSSVFSRFGKIIPNLNKQLQPFFPASLSILYSQTFSKIPSPGGKEIYELSYDDYVEILKPEIYRIRNSAEPATIENRIYSQRVNFWKYHSTFEHKSYLDSSKYITGMNQMILFYTSFYPKTIYNVSSTGGKVNRQFISYSNDLKILNPEIQTIRNNPKSENVVSYSYVTSSNANSLLLIKGGFRSTIRENSRGSYELKYKYPALLANEQPFLDNRGPLKKGTYLFKETYQSPPTFIKLIFRRKPPKFGSEAFFTTQRSTSLNDGDNFYFHNNRKIEQAVEKVKKIAHEAKETAMKGQEKSLGEMDICRLIDLNRLSDQVYQNIERRLRIERERRGL